MDTTSSPGKVHKHSAASVKQINTQQLNSHPSIKDSRDQAEISTNVDFGVSAQHVLLLGLVI
eukprot:5727741-Pleurochrysis_carterae.AAC.1